MPGGRPVLYHNPRCGKSREAKKALEDRGVEFDLVLYLATPPTAEELKEIVRKLGATARDVLRTGEEEFRALGLDDPSKTEDEILRAIARNPILLQRPIFVKGDRAAIGRPLENVLSLLD